MNKIFKKKDIKIDNNVIKLNIDDTTVEAPFPNYENDDDKSSINQKGDNNYLAKQFKNFIGFNKDILEVGCGTGQLSLYFSIGNNNRVYALDPTLASINLGKEFAKKNKIENIKFINADIFEYQTERLVSSDHLGTTKSVIIDSNFIDVIDLRINI